MIKNHGIRYRKKKKPSASRRQYCLPDKANYAHRANQHAFFFFFFGLEAGNVEAEGNRSAPGVNGQICNYHTGSL